MDGLQYVGRLNLPSLMVCDSIVCEGCQWHSCQYIDWGVWFGMEATCGHDLDSSCLWLCYTVFPSSPAVHPLPSGSTFVDGPPKPQVFEAFPILLLEASFLMWCEEPYVPQVRTDQALPACRVMCRVIEVLLSACCGTLLNQGVTQQGSGTVVALRGVSQYCFPTTLCSPTQPSRTANIHDSRTCLPGLEKTLNKEETRNISNFFGKDWCGLHYSVGVDDDRLKCVMHGVV